VTISARSSMTVLTLAQTAGQTGSWAALVAALPLALSRPDAATWVAIITIAWGGLAAVSQFTTRRLVDRYGPRRTGMLSWAMAATGAAAAALITGSLAVVVAALGVMSAARGLAVLAGDVAPTWLPHRPDLTRAGSWLMLAAAVPVLAGPLGAAGILTGYGPRAAWLTVAGLFLAAAAAAALVPSARPGPATTAAAVRLRWLVKILSVLAITAGVWLTYGAMTVLQPLYVQDELHSTLVTYGWTMAAFALGGAGVALAALRLRAAVAWRWSVPLAALATAGGERLFTATTSVPMAMLGLVWWGASAAVFSLASRSVIVSAVPPEAHGRALGLWRGTQAAANIAPALVVGQLTAAAGLRSVLTWTCALAGACGLAYLLGAAVAHAPRWSPGAVAAASRPGGGTASPRGG
jgi:MFS family permease